MSMIVSIGVALLLVFFWRQALALLMLAVLAIMILGIASLFHMVDGGGVDAEPRSAQAAHRH
ncbi:MAG: hypothetical protein ACRCYQ_16145 [Nocardioides sp.]